MWFVSGVGNKHHDSSDSIPAVAFTESKRQIIPRGELIIPRSFFFFHKKLLGGSINHAYDKSFSGGQEKAGVEVASFCAPLAASSGTSTKRWLLLCACHVGLSISPSFLFYFLSFPFSKINFEPHKDIEMDSRYTSLSRSPF